MQRASKRLILNQLRGGENYVKCRRTLDNNKIVSIITIIVI